MFASFDKAFNNGKVVQKIPQLILDTLSDNLPKGVKYEQVDSETCIVVPEGECMDLTINVMSDNEFKAKNPQELMQYLYRTQKKLEVKSNYIKVNGETINISDLVIMPLSKDVIKREDAKFYICPNKFPEPFEIPFEYEKDKVILVKMQRQPYADLHKSLFKSIDLRGIEISYLVDEIGNNMTINFKLKTDDVESVEEIIIGLKLYQSFKNGFIKIGKHVIKGAVKEEKELSDLKKLIEFWEKVKILSRKLGFLFEPKKNITKEEAELVEALYKSFQEDKENRTYIHIDKLTLTFKDKVDLGALMEQENISLRLRLNREYEVLKRQVTLWSSQVFTNLKIEKIKQKNKDLFVYDIYVKPLSEKGILKIEKYFKNEEELNVYESSVNY